MSGREANYIALSADSEEHALPTIYHEFVHAMLNNSVAGMPLWFSEGLAEYYSTFALQGGTRVEYELRTHRLTAGARGAGRKAQAVY